MIRVFLVDDHTVLRNGLRSLLADQSDLTVVGEAGDGRELLAKLPTTPTDVVLLDINMPGLNGLDTARQLQKEYPAVRVLVMTMLIDKNHIFQMLDAGAAGYVLKNVGRDELTHGIRMVASGQPFLCAEVGFDALQRLREEKNGPSVAASGKAGVLSKREIEILQLIAEGLTNQEISDKLFISKRTTETHRLSIIGKTKMKNTASLIRFAVSEGLVD